MILVGIGKINLILIKGVDMGYLMGIFTAFVCIFMLLSLSPPYITFDEFSKGIEVCKEHGGIKKMDIFGKATCNNGIVIDITELDLEKNEIN